jgi:glc operon protein GlcG
MKTKHSLEAADVKAILTAAEAEARAHSWAVSIAVVDDGGHMLGFLRLDGASAGSAHMAPAKAATSIMGRRESKVYEDLILGGRVSMLSAPAMQALLEGGVPIVVDGDFIGAVGVKSEQDAQVAKAGIAAIVV